MMLSLAVAPFAHEAAAASFMISNCSGPASIATVMLSCAWKNPYCSVSPPPILSDPPIRLLGPAPGHLFNMQ